VLEATGQDSLKVDVSIRKKKKIERSRIVGQQGCETTGKMNSLVGIFFTFFVI